MTNITFPLSEANVAQCMAERDAEIEQLRRDEQDREQAIAKHAELVAENERLRKLCESHGIKT